MVSTQCACLPKRYTMSSMPSVLKLPLLLSGAILVLLSLAAHARAAPRKSEILPDTNHPPAATAWSHDERMRLYSWVIINDNLRECNRVLDVVEKNDGSVLATCSAYAVEGGVVKVRRYRVDQLPLKPGFSERWFNIAPVRAPDAGVASKSTTQRR